ncbi:hypothetical protein Q1695_007709 [Nippostrongylus brasiliensis]|nr:hypothetical protein Q1695_007709 [Nippostrongylus brasiliensis]
MAQDGTKWKRRLRYRARRIVGEERVAVLASKKLDVSRIIWHCRFDVERNIYINPTASEKHDMKNHNCKCVFLSSSSESV